MAARSKCFRVVDESIRAEHGHEGHEPVSVRRTSAVDIFFYLYVFLYFLCLHFYYKYKFVGAICCVLQIQGIISTADVRFLACANKLLFSAFL